MFFSYSDSFKLLSIFPSEGRSLCFESKNTEKILIEILKDNNCFVMPNINPNNRGRSLFHALKGTIINEEYFYSSAEKAFILSNLMSSLVSTHHIGLISADKKIPVMITG